jgi:hypothetical protein
MGVDVQPWRVQSTSVSGWSVFCQDRCQITFLRVDFSQEPISQNSGARRWGASSRSDLSFAEQIMLAALVHIRAITVVMCEHRAWNVEPGPSMLVSGVTSPRDSRCVVSSGVPSSSCVGAISSGDGRDIFSAWRSAMTFQVSSIE